jgi:tight adherence protein C
MELFVAILLFIGLAAAISFTGYRLYAKPSKGFDQIRIPLPDADSFLQEPVKDSPKILLIDAIQKLGDFVPTSPQDTAFLRRQLIAAGYRTDRAVKVFYGFKVAGAMVFALLALLFRDLLPLEGGMVLLGIVAAGVLGYAAPGFLLGRLVSRRQVRLKRSLPDSLDLMVVCVEAGLGLDQAIASVSKELHIAHPEICEELTLVTLEMRAGTRRLDALRNVADRTGVSEIKKLVGVLVQSDRFGTGIGEALRMHSDYMRIQRRQEAEEKANKVAVKLVFPIFFFILPAIVLIAVGPAVLQIFKVLLPTMRNLGGE